MGTIFAFFSFRLRSRSGWRARWRRPSFARLGRTNASVPTWVLPVPTQRHRYAVVVFGEAGFGELEFEFGEDVGGGQNRIRVFADLARHFEQNAMDLGLFFIQQAHQFVVLLDGLERLDKDGLSAGTGAVHYTLHAALLLHFYWDDKALAADGDQFVLHRAAFGKFPQVAAQGFLNLAFLLLDLTANAAQFGRRAIVERAIRQNLVAERTQEAGEVLDTSGKRGHGGPVGAHGGGGWRTISRHSAPRSATSTTSRISVVSRAAPPMRDFSISFPTSGSPANSNRPPTRRYSRISVVSCCCVSIQA